nr:hypothetical protein [Coralloluteibacterium stylophorae]
MADGDVGQARVRIRRQRIGQQRRDRLVDALEQAAVNGDSDQRGDDHLGGGLDVGRRVLRAAVVAARGEQFAVAGDQHGAQRGERGRLVEDGVERGGGPCRGGHDGREEHEPGEEDADRTHASK